MQWVRRNLKFLIPAGVVLAGIGIYLFFFVFAFHLMFIDDEVDEAGPVFDSGADASAQGAASVSPDEVVVVEETPAADAATTGGDEAVIGTDENKIDKSGPGGEVQASLDAVAEATSEAADETANDDVSPTTETPVATASAEAQIATLVEGSFIPRGRYSGEGRAFVLNDGSEQRFLRFEDFATDNGPDLNVYLVNSEANADEGTFDDDFIDLGDLQGNIGNQNYEIPAEVDLAVYDTVVVWCVRFGSAFTAADLLPV
ncbi:MAG: DM13 domain-containing protein [Actinomycetota bacterium]